MFDNLREKQKNVISADFFLNLFSTCLKVSSKGKEEETWYVILQFCPKLLPFFHAEGEECTADSIAIGSLSSAPIQFGCVFLQNKLLSLTIM